MQRKLKVCIIFPTRIGCIWIWNSFFKVSEFEPVAVIASRSQCASRTLLLLGNFISKDKVESYFHQTFKVDMISYLNIDQDTRPP